MKFHKALFMVFRWNNLKIMLDEKVIELEEKQG